MEYSEEFSKHRTLQPSSFKRSDRFWFVIRYPYPFDSSILKSSVNIEFYSPLASKEVTGFGL